MNKHEFDEYEISEYEDLLLRCAAFILNKECEKEFDEAVKNKVTLKNDKEIDARIMNLIKENSREEKIKKFFSSYYMKATIFILCFISLSGVMAFKEADAFRETILN